MSDPADPADAALARDPDARLRCDELVELVTPYLEGVLAPDAVARVEHHLALCPGCDAYVDQMRQTIALAGRLTPEAVPEESVDRLLAAFRASRDAAG
jgi:anti-sigma factor RsiW